MHDEHRVVSSILGRTLDTPESASQLPNLNDDYKASGMVDSDCFRLTLINGKKGFEPGGRAYIALQYVHIGTGEFGFTKDGQIFTFLYSELQPKLLTVEGRNLLRIFDNITTHRMPWIRVIDRDLRAVDDVSQEPVITALKLELWKPEKEDA